MQFAGELDKTKNENEIKMYDITDTCSCTGFKRMSHEVQEVYLLYLYMNTMQLSVSKLFMFISNKEF